MIRKKIQIGMQLRSIRCRDYALLEHALGSFYVNFALIIANARQLHREFLVARDAATHQSDSLLKLGNSRPVTATQNALNIAL